MFARILPRFGPRPHRAEPIDRIDTEAPSERVFKIDGVPVRFEGLAGGVAPRASSRAPRRPATASGAAGRIGEEVLNARVIDAGLQAASMLGLDGEADDVVVSLDRMVADGDRTDPALSLVLTITRRPGAATQRA